MHKYSEWGTVVGSKTNTINKHVLTNFLCKYINCCMQYQYHIIKKYSFMYRKYDTSPHSFHLSHHSPGWLLVGIKSRNPGRLRRLPLSRLRLSLRRARMQYRHSFKYQQRDLHVFFIISFSIKLITGLFVLALVSRWSVSQHMPFLPFLFPFGVPPAHGRPLFCNLGWAIM